MTKSHSNMERKEWNHLLDRFLECGEMEIEDWEKLKTDGTELQNIIINEIMKAFNRLNKREIDTIHHSLQNNE